MLYLVSLLFSFNQNMTDRIVVDCPCYRRHYGSFAKMRKFILNGGTLSACYADRVTGTISHMTLPVMLGSWIHFALCDFDVVEFEATRPFWGVMLFNGALRKHSSFSTLDSCSLHIRQKKDERSVEWFTYSGTKGLETVYRDNRLYWKHDNQTSINHSDDNNLLNQERWSLLVHANAPTKVDNIRIHYTRYLEMYAYLTREKYDMNSFIHRKLVTHVIVYNKFLKKIEAFHRKNGTLPNFVGGIKKSRLLNMFVTGSVYMTLARNNPYETDEFCKTYTQTHDSGFSDGRSDKVEYLLPTTNRVANETLRNSNSFQFSESAVDYCCMINTKDLKQAGEQHCLANNVIYSEETDTDKAYAALKELFFGRAGAKETVLNGYLVNLKVDWTFDDVVALKRKLPHLTTKHTSRYVFVLTSGSIPIKYLQSHDVYVSPAETEYFKIEFPELDRVSALAELMGLENLRRSMPSKLTVGINIAKGSVARKLETPYHPIVMLNSPGFSCSVVIDEEFRRAMLDSTIIPESEQTKEQKQAASDRDRIFSRFHRLVAEDLADPNWDRVENVGDGTAIRTSPQAAMISLLKMYDYKRCVSDMRRVVVPNEGQPREFYTTNESENGMWPKRLQAYLSTVLAQRNYAPNKLSNFDVWVTFADEPGTSDDGLVVERESAELIPMLDYQFFVSVMFTFSTKNKLFMARFSTFADDPDDFCREMDDCNDEWTSYYKVRNSDSRNFIGQLITDSEVRVKENKHCQIDVSTIGNHFNYLIFFNNPGLFDAVYVRRRVDIDQKTLTVSVFGKSRVPATSGTKFGNIYGQKNLVNEFKPRSHMRQYWGVTQNGRVVSAQFVYSIHSAFKRLLASHMLDAFRSKDLALTPDLKFVVPISVFIHALTPRFSGRVMKIKLDTLTNINGSDSMGTNLSTSRMKLAPSSERTRMGMNLQGYDFRFVNDYVVASSASDPSPSQMTPTVSSTSSTILGSDTEEEENCGGVVSFCLDENDPFFVDGEVAAGDDIADEDDEYNDNDYGNDGGDDES